MKPTRVYIDTGVFLDYLALRGHAGSFLRTTGRRTRTVEQLSADAATCVSKVNTNHQGLTSSLTLYEVENAMYESLRNRSGGLSDHHRYIITSARSLTIQVLSMIYYHDRIRVADLTQSIFERTVSEIELQKRAIQAADSIHIVTALMNNVDVIISTDDDMLDLDKVFQNASGSKILCLDTDRALAIL